MSSGLTGLFPILEFCDFFIPTLCVLIQSRADNLAVSAIGADPGGIFLEFLGVIIHGGQEGQ